MYIQNENKRTRVLRDPHVVALLGDVDVDEVLDPQTNAADVLDDPTDAEVEFNAEGKARVTKEVGELLADKYDGITIVDRESDETSDESDDGGSE